MDNNNLIDRYFDGEMSEVEMKAFESSVKHDPVLEKEFLFQQEIIESIKATRMAEIKANLNAIDISGAASGTGSSWIYKTVASVAVVGGAITYFTVFNNPFTTKEEITTPVENITSTEVTQFEVTDSEVIEEGVIESKSEVESISKKPIVTASAKKDEVAEIRDTESSSLVSPAITDDFGDIDDAASNALAPVNELIDKSAFEHSTISIELNNNKQKYNFHYQLKNNKLFLYGNFDKVYEVLDFKHKDQSDLFFFYDNKYYDIDDASTSINAFVEIEGEELSELKQKIFSNENAKSQ